MKILNQLLLITSMALTTISAQATTYKFQIQDTNVTSATFIGDSGSEVQVSTDPIQYNYDNFMPVSTGGFLDTFTETYGYYTDMTDCSETLPFDSLTTENQLLDGVDANGISFFFTDQNGNNTYEEGIDTNKHYFGMFDKDEGWAHFYYLCKY